MLKWISEKIDKRYFWLAPELRLFIALLELAFIGAVFFFGFFGWLLLVSYLVSDITGSF